MTSAPHKPDFLGELPCTACGYARRGLDRRLPCSECGKPGFEAEFVASGAGALAVGPLWWRWLRTFVFLSAAVAGLASAGAAGWSLPALDGWRFLLGFVYWPVTAVVVQLWLVFGVALFRARASRRDESAEGCVWEFSRAGVTIRRRCQPTIVIPGAEVSELFMLPSHRAETILVLSQRVSMHKPRNFRLIDRRRMFANHQLILRGTAEGRIHAIDEMHRILSLPKSSAESFRNILSREA